MLQRKLDAVLQRKRAHIRQSVRLSHRQGTGTGQNPQNSQESHRVRRLGHPPGFVKQTLIPVARCPLITTGIASGFGDAKSRRRPPDARFRIQDTNQRSDVSANCAARRLSEELATFQFEHLLARVLGLRVGRLKITKPLRQQRPPIPALDRPACRKFHLAQLAALFRRSDTARHSLVSGTASTTINSASAPSHSCSCE